MTLIATRNTTRRVALGLALTATLATAACGVPERVAGLHAAPTETVAGAPFGEATAQQVTATALSAADAVQAARKPTSAQLEAVLTGPALRLAEVAPRFRAERQALTSASAPTILAISAGRDWPRSILATTQLDGVQRVHVLISASPTQPFKLWLTTDLLPGASIPAFPALGEGTTVVGTDHGLVATPKQVYALYAQFLNYPKAKKSSTVVSARDAFASAVRASSAAQAKSLGALGTFKRANSLLSSSLLAFRLADGSAIAFGQITRADTIKPTKKAKRLDLPKDLAALAKRKSVTDHLSLHTLQTLVTVIPVENKARVIGADEQLTRLSAK